MSKTRSGYPIGATWSGVDPIDGRIGKVWLSDAIGNFEMWRWSAVWSDGSLRGSGDWRYTKKAAREECPVRGRFKRVK